MMAQQMNVDNISNNIANMTTTGYKRSRLEFKDLMYQHIDRPGSVSSASGTLVPTGLSLGAWVFALPLPTASKNREHWNRPPMIWIWQSVGVASFQIELPNGETAYTRAGAFQTNADGEIVTSEGYRLLPGFTVPADTLYVEVSTEGQISVKQPATTTMTVIGQLEIVDFVNPAGLEATGDTMFLETDASGQADCCQPWNRQPRDIVRQGMLRTIQRRFSQGNYSADYRATRLRDEFQRHQHI
jgi:flagellar basal-body rod protein FlgG